MSLFKSKRKKQITSEFDSTSQSALLPVQNVYSAYNRLPSPVHTVDQDLEDVYSTSNIRSKFHREHFNKHHRNYHPQKPHQTSHDRTEKFSQQQKLIKEAEERAAANLHKKSSYARLLCCFCFPCLPMWTRTICCFALLLICGLSCLLLFVTLSFKQPQVVLNGGNNTLLEYSIYNANYFEINFDKIKAVMYYPTPNQTTIGVGEVSDIILRPHAVTNITFPMQLLSSSFDKTDRNTTVQVKDNNNSIIKSTVAQLCSEETNNSGDPKEIDIVYDLMPTFKFGDYGALSLSFTGQKTKISCEKLQNIASDS
ncbi:hypothetical protein MAM1_0366c10070 [Mucor ambiguus]|uniref:Late embryogenesis abundant protein LEA-2 subgroup domain-containing protein n=1 Tax=Mucor ambiguus TaxID=91626 RepID=A0A0C9N7A9_9FUNG|nr:hypothetical protein MAM1_0366c10070 [Mucor ambiguus]